MDYILALKKRTTLNGKPQGVGYEFQATAAMKRHLVDQLDQARVVAEVSDGKVATVAPPAPPAEGLDELAYNELRQLAKEMGLDASGKADEIRARIAEHQKGASEEE